MADRNIRIRISAQDMASGVIGQVRSQLAGVAAGFASGQFAVDAFYKVMELARRSLAASYDEFVKAEQGLVRLKNAFGNLGHGMQQAVARAEEFSGRMQAALGVDDDEVIAVQEKFARALGITGKALEDATQAALDFAAGSGKSIDEAATAMIKGAMGSGRALKEYGIEVVDTGDKLRNLSQIQEELNGKFAGSAIDNLDTVAGATQALQNALVNLGGAMVGAGAEAAGYKDGLLALAETVETLNGAFELLWKLAGGRGGPTQFWADALRASPERIAADNASMLRRGGNTADGRLPVLGGGLGQYTGDLGPIITSEQEQAAKRLADALKDREARTRELASAEKKEWQAVEELARIMEIRSESMMAAMRAEQNVAAMFPMGPGNARALPYTGPGTGNQPGDSSWFNPGELPFDFDAMDKLIEKENEATTSMLEFKAAVEQTSAAMISGFVASGVMSIFDEGADGARNMGEAVKQLVKQLIAAVIQMAIMRAIMAGMSGGTSMLLNTGGVVRAAVGRGRSPAVPGMWGLQPDFSSNWGGGIPSWVGLENPLGPYRRPERRQSRAHVDYIPALLSPGEVVLSPPAAERFYASSPSQAPGVQLGMTVVGTSELARLLSSEVSSFVRRRGGTMYAG